MKKAFLKHLAIGVITAIAFSLGLLTYFENSFFGYINIDIVLNMLKTNIFSQIGVIIGVIFLPIFIHTLVMIYKDEKTSKILKHGLVALVGIFATIVLQAKAMLDLRIDLPKIDHSISCIDSTIDNQKVISCSNGYIYPIMTSDALDVKPMRYKEALNW